MAEFWQQQLQSLRQEIEEAEMKHEAEIEAQHAGGFGCLLPVLLKGQQDTAIVTGHGNYITSSRKNEVYEGACRDKGNPHHRRLRQIQR